MSLDTIKSILEFILIPALLGTGIFLTIRLGFIQFRRFVHGINVARGKYDDPDAPGDVTHFQALTTALSATVGIGNIAGVALAIHWGGPGAIFWMWVTAVLGMATKFTEVTLAQRYRVTDTGSSGLVSGGPMYYMEKGLGKSWKPLAVFFALALTCTAMITGNAVQANTVADMVQTIFGVPPLITGLVMAATVGLVIIGGIRRISKVTEVLAPSMAAIYVLGGLAVLVVNFSEILPAFQLILTEAFQPTAGVAGTGTGIFLQTLLWGVRRGLFSNEAGQGSAPIAHSAARTDEPVSEGSVALLEPFIDTILICTITALAIITTGVWKETTPTVIELQGGDVGYVEQLETGFAAKRPGPDSEVLVVNGRQEQAAGSLQVAWHEVPPAVLYADSARTQTFSGKILPGKAIAVSEDGREFDALYGDAVENGAPLTMWAYSEVLGNFGVGIVMLCVLLFGISTAISWSYYGDRCVTYLLGEQALFGYRIVYMIMHFLGAILALNTIWSMGDIAMSLATIPNIFALLLLSGVAVRLSREYFSKWTDRES